MLVMYKHSSLFCHISNNKVRTDFYRIALKIPLMLGTFKLPEKRNLFNSYIYLY